MSMLGERLEPLLPNLAALQRKGAVTIEKVQIVERAMNKLSRPGLNAEDVETAERLLTEYAPVLGPTDLRRFALQVVDAADPDGPEPVDDQLQQDRRYLDLKQRRDGMWHLQGRLTSTVGVQLNAILDPWLGTAAAASKTKTARPPRYRMNGPRATHARRGRRGLRPAAQDEGPAAVGGIPASVIVTVPLEDLLAKAGIAETNDGTSSPPINCCGSPMKLRSGPPSSTATTSHSRSAEPDGSPPAAKPWR